MKNRILFFTVLVLAAPNMALAAAKCSIANLTRCLDSVCAINVSSNPAARCQYCGSSDAGEPPADSGMRSVSVGASAKYALTKKEQKDMPDDPGERYAWATARCIKKVSGCTPDDVSDNYDQLIEQSCTAAGISAQMASLHAAAKKTKTKTSCKTDIQACLIDAKRCNADYRTCAENADFDKFFSACGVDATGCDEYIGEIRTELLSARDSAIANADQALTKIVTAYQSARDKKLNSAMASCENNAGRDACIESVCKRSMKNKCGAGFESERSMATQLCKFFDLACDVLK